MDLNANPTRRARAAWEDVVHTGPDSLAGRDLRCIWHPIWVTTVLKPGRPKPLKIMDENSRFIAARVASRISWIFDAFIAARNSVRAGSKATSCLASIMAGNAGRTASAPSNRTNRSRSANAPRPSRSRRSFLPGFSCGEAPALHLIGLLLRGLLSALPLGAWLLLRPARIAIARSDTMAQPRRGARLAAAVSDYRSDCIQESAG
jgi:hypothetical protein